MNNPDNDILAERELLTEVEMINKTVATRAMIEGNLTSTSVRGEHQLTGVNQQSDDTRKGQEEGQNWKTRNKALGRVQD